MTTRFQIGLLAFAGASIGALGAGLAASTGCTVLTNDAPPDDASFEGGREAGTSACNACLAHECLGVWAVCSVDDGCRAVRACAAGGGSSAACFCSSAFVGLDGGPSPQGAYRALASCDDAKTCGACKTECASTCAGGSPLATPGPSCGDASGDGDGAVEAAPDDAGAAGDAAAEDAAPSDAAAPVSVDGCSSCIADRCGDAKQACAPGAECAAFLDCTYACTSAACQDACATAHATGKESASELSSCALASCRDACGF